MRKTATLPLSPHPAAAAGAVDSLTAELSFPAPDRISILYRLTGRVDRIRIPAAVHAKRADGLWRHTCFELFACAARNAGYLEFNFSPSTEWAAYQFNSYREGMSPIANCAPPEIVTARSDSEFSLQAAADLSGMRSNRPDQGAAPRRIALSAVIEEMSGAKSYWALRHPGSQPDFHNPAGFAHEIDEDLRP